MSFTIVFCSNKGIATALSGVIIFIVLKYLLVVLSCTKLTLYAQTLRLYSQWTYQGKLCNILDIKDRLRLCWFKVSTDGTKRHALNGNGS